MCHRVALKTISAHPSACSANIDAVVQFGADAVQRIWSCDANCLSDGNVQLLQGCRWWWYVNCALHVAPKERSGQQLGPVISLATRRTRDHLVQHDFGT